MADVIETLNRRLRLCAKVYDAPGEAKPDGWIIAKLATRMVSEGFGWENSNEVLEEGSRFSSGARRDFHLVKIAVQGEGKTLGEFGTNGIRGPVLMRADGTLEDTGRLHHINRVLPADGPAAGLTSCSACPGTGSRSIRRPPPRSASGPATT